MVTYPTPLYAHIHIINNKIFGLARWLSVLEAPAGKSDKLSWISRTHSGKRTDPQSFPLISTQATWQVCVHSAHICKIINVKRGGRKTRTRQQDSKGRLRNSHFWPSYLGTQSAASAMCVWVTIAGAGGYGLPIRTLPELVILCGVLIICRVGNKKIKLGIHTFKLSTRETEASGSSVSLRLDLVSNK